MKFKLPNEALISLSHELQPVSTEALETNHQGRILAGTVTADRDSPAADVSAMEVTPFV